MLSTLDVNLEFQDYSSTGGQVEAPSSVSSSSQERVNVQIEINDDANQSRLAETPTKQGGLFQSLLQSTINETESTMSEEFLHNLMRAQSRFRQQQKTSQTAGGFNWGLNYFAQYFDVDTDEILERIIWSAIPLRRLGLDLENIDDPEVMAPLANETSLPMDTEKLKSFSAARQRPYSYVERFIQNRPDLYGPFWVSATLVFAIATFSNIVSFKAYKSKLDMPAVHAIRGETNGTFASTSMDHLHIDQEALVLSDWNYSIEQLNIMSSVIIFYVMIFPAFLWLLFWFRGCNKCYTLTETICAYGYSLSIFIPLSFLLIIQSSFFRYSVLALSTTLSGIVLTLSFLPVVRSDPHPASSHLILAVVPLCHCYLAYVIHRIMLP